MVTVDKQDSDLLEFHWTILQEDRREYAVRGDNVRMHRVIMSRVLERDLLSTEYVDHKDNNGLNNSRSNLRLATNAQNQANARKQVNNTSGYKGVSLHKASGRYAARLMHNGVMLNLGYFDTPEDAARAYDERSKELNGEYAKLNFSPLHHG